MSKPDGGKGSAPRPFSVSQDTYAGNWERIFGARRPYPDRIDPVRKDEYDAGLDNVDEPDDPDADA